ncbi:unnamed protein product [Prunus armeniaca]|uniref:Uncharacterized protein n=1 Tax=Prunus armeniaca TaxID=36596 RepID=A0A6J5TMX2_PRUAR|nr:unnamed protein product [Prunus armeniaca]
MPYSPWDIPMLSNPNEYSNFQCFLQSITPSVLTQQQPPKVPVQMLNGCLSQSLGNNSTGCFSLSDLWKFYKDWSCFGAGVPILLNSGDSVLQYYSPSLSALQIYTRKPVDYYSRLGISCTPKLESDSSDVTSDDSTGDHEVSCQTTERFGHLYCQYNETASPYDRVPLTDKINELAQNYPALLKFQSVQLSPYSWMAVAWYPIYQIPFTRNAKDLSACFITYNTLSSFQGLPCTILEEDEKFQNINTLGKEWGGRMLERDSRRGEIALPPFAVATYKMYGELWTNPETSDKENIASYLNAANSWLKHCKFQHHDFNFFMSRR